MTLIRWAYSYHPFKFYVCDFSAEIGRIIKMNCQRNRPKFKAVYGLGDQFLYLQIFF